MKKAILLCLAVGLISLSTFSQTAKENEVISVVKKAAEAQENYDSATLNTVYASDYIEISPKGEIDEREKAIGFYKVEDVEKVKSRTPRYILDEFKVRHYGKFAIVITKLSFGSKNDLQRPSMAVGIVTYALRKEKKVWKIYSAQFTPFPISSPKPKSTE